MLPPKLKEDGRQVALRLYSEEDNDIVAEFVERMISKAYEKLNRDFTTYPKGSRVLSIAVEMHLFMASVGAELLTHRASTEAENKADHRLYLTDLTEKLEEFCKQ